MFSAQTSHNYSAQFESVQIRIKETLNASKKKNKKKKNDVNRAQDNKCLRI